MGVAGINESGLREWTQWSGGETLLPGTCVTTKPVDDTIFASLQERSIGGGPRHRVGRRGCVRMKRGNNGRTDSGAAGIDESGLCEWT